MSVDAITSATSQASVIAGLSNRAMRSVVAIQDTTTSTPRRGNSSGSEDSTSTTYSLNFDKRDTNRDGLVSWLEQQSYFLAHPEAKVFSDFLNKLQTPSRNTGSLLDTFA